MSKLTFKQLAENQDCPTWREVHREVNGHVQGHTVPQSRLGFEAVPVTVRFNRSVDSDEVTCSTLCLELGSLTDPGLELETGNPQRSHLPASKTLGLQVKAVTLGFDVGAMDLNTGSQVHRPASGLPAEEPSPQTPTPSFFF